MQWHPHKKQSLFSREERMDLIEDATKELQGIRVTYFDHLLVDFAVENEASAVVRGLRVISDFEFEFQMALMNRKLKPSLETIFLMPKEDYTYISSRVVKEIARFHGNVSQFVPEAAAQALKAKFAG